MSIAAAYIVPHPPIILPAIGKGEELKISDTVASFKRVAEEIKAIAPDTIVVVSPHATMYMDYMHISPGNSANGDFSRFGAMDTDIKVKYDTGFVKAIEKNAKAEGISAGTLGEREKSLDHGVLVPLYFINQEYTQYKLVRIGISGLEPLEHYRLGKVIAKTSEEMRRKTVFIASGDLSHKLKSDGPYGFSPEGPLFDSILIKAAANADFLDMMAIPPSMCKAASECGQKSFIIMAGALDSKKLTSELLSYEGPFGVGYAVCSYKIAGDDPSRQFDILYEDEEKKKIAEIRAGEDKFVKLAREAAEHYVETGTSMVLPKGLPQEMTSKRAGVFVSCKKRGELRGCIGTIYPVSANIASEIVRNAKSAVAEDPRFPPVQKKELPLLTYSVDVLGQPEPTDFSGLDPQNYGLIVTSKNKRGLLLPDLEGIDTPEKQVKIALQKAGIKEPYTMERFLVVRHK